MGGVKKRQRRKRNSAAIGATKRRAPSRNENAARPSRGAVKDFEIFVTDFLTDPCGLPLELKDHVLVDGTVSSADTPDICSPNNTQVLKKIFGNHECIDRMTHTPGSIALDDSSEKGQ